MSMFALEAVWVCPSLDYECSCVCSESLGFTKLSSPEWDAADFTFSSLHPPCVLFTLLPNPAAMPPRRHSRPPRSRQLPPIGQRRALAMGTALGRVGQWHIEVGSFYAAHRQESEGMITHNPGLDIENILDAAAQCGEATSRKWIFAFCVLWPENHEPIRRKWNYEDVLHRLKIRRGVLSCRFYSYILSGLTLAGGFHTILLKFPLNVTRDVIFDTLRSWREFT